MTARRMVSASPSDLWAWDVDPTRHFFRHANGLRVIFVRGSVDDDWHPVPLMPLPIDFCTLDLSRYVAAAVQLFTGRQAIANSCPRAGGRAYCRGNERKKSR